VYKLPDLPVDVSCSGDYGEKMIGNPVRKLSSVKPIDVLCGKAFEISGAKDFANMSIAVVEVLDAPTHYHKKMTEFYYILEGKGEVKLNGKLYSVEKDTTVLIEPLIKHSIKSANKFPIKLVAITTPAFEMADEFPVNA
jgi:mannose-6-phosphate isomerase-like protein (cupin superfamily)